MQIRVTSALLESNENRNHDSAMLGGANESPVYDMKMRK